MGKPPCKTETVRATRCFVGVMGSVLRVRSVVSLADSPEYLPPARVLTVDVRS